MVTKYLTLFLLLICSISSAQERKEPMTLSELVDLALENDPSTKQAWWNAHRAAAALGSANSAYYPQANLEGYAANGRTFKFVNGPDASYTIVGADLVLSLLLYDSGARAANVRGAKHALIAANWQSDDAIQRVLARVLENAYELANAQETLKATLVTRDDADQILKIAQELNRAGLTPISDVYSALASQSQTLMEIEQLKAQVDIKRGKLLINIGLNPETPFELAAFTQLPAPEKKQLCDLMNLAARQRADLLAKQERVKESYARQDKEKAGYGPQIGLRGTGGANHAFQDKANALQYSIRLTAEIPLFDGFNTMYRNRMAYADTRISIEELNDLRMSIYVDVLTYSRLFESAQAMLPNAENNYNHAQKAYEGFLERYKAGKSDIGEVSVALRQLAAARVRLSDVKTRWLVALANLAYATGTLTPYTETTCE